MNNRPTPETDAAIHVCSDTSSEWHGDWVSADDARRLERERDEAREWQAMLSGWGGTPEIVHEFIKGQQSRIHAAQEVERERDEARDASEKAKAFKRVMKDDNAKLRRELDKAQRDADTFLENFGKTQERAINAERELDELNKRLIEVCQYGVVCTIEREDLRKELAAERALADRLADSLTACERWVNQPCDVKTEANKALMELKEARK